MDFATESVAGIERRTCTWSSTPPTTNAFILFSRAIPPRYGQSRCWRSGLISGRRSLVAHTQCIRQLVKECMVFLSFVLAGLVLFNDLQPSDESLGYCLSPCRA